ncbi:MAG: G1 family glutamic endopeptidase [Nitrososphaerales archaeon]
MQILDKDISRATLAIAAAFAILLLTGLVYYGPQIPVEAVTTQPSTPVRTITTLQSEIVSEVYLVKDGWAGYAANATKEGQAEFVNGTWTVPGSHCAPNQTSTVLVWVGLGGNNGGGIEQIGTRNDCVDGRPSYSAWYELWPSQSSTMPLTGLAVGPGDNVSASVRYSGQTKSFDFLLGNGTETASFSLPYADSSVSSAEWVVEAPGFTNGTRLPLLNFTTVSFSGAFATIGNHTGTITGLGSQPFSNLFALTYSCQNDTMAQPGPVANGGEDFTITWLSGNGC